MPPARARPRAAASRSAAPRARPRPHATPARHAAPASAAPTATGIRPRAPEARLRGASGRVAQWESARFTRERRGDKSLQATKTSRQHGRRSDDAAWFGGTENRLELLREQRTVA